ncbi:MAG TPA: hypothetical protein H9752_01095 [Candidatus Phocaeicola excrementigallinarum]|nr:hypothetical protein [Candidatus Phocaeicola excrementigallinarum]
MKKKWAGMLMGMCAVVLSFSLAGCGKDDVVTENTIVEGDSVIITTVPVSFNLQAEGASRTLGGVNFNEFDVYAYIFQSEKSRSSRWVPWGDEWSFYELNLYQKVESQKFTVDLVEKGSFLSFQYKYQYKIVFLTAPKGSSVFPTTLEKEIAYDEALTNPFKWNVDETQTDNAIYRDVVEILSNDKDNFDDIAFEGNITDIPVELYHKDGVLRVTVAQDLLPANIRSKAVKAELTIDNVPEQMYLKGSSSPDDDEVYCKGTQSLTKTLGINFSSGDVKLEIHSLPQYPISEATTTGGISCTVCLLDKAGNELASNSFDSDANVYIYPNTISNVRLTKTGFEFGIDLEDDVWDGPNAANNLN